MTDYVFHVLHNARPEYELDILTLLQDGQECTYEALLQEGQELGLTIGYQVKTERLLRDVLQPLRDLGLMERRQIQLTKQGQIVAQIASKNADLFPEIIHYLYYTTWQAHQAPENCFSWSYRTLCNYLWQQGSCVIDNTLFASLVSAEASQSFQIQSVSFSDRSVNGITIWLEALTPPAIHPQDEKSARFSRRTFCPPELLVLAVDFVYHQDRIDYGANLLLNDQRQEAICQLCLLQPGGFDRVLEYAVAQFQGLEKGLGGGWGSYLTLHQPPDLADFV